MKLFFFVLLLSLTNIAVADIDINRIKSKLAGTFNGNIPKGVLDWIAVLDDSVDILSCIPTIKQGSCYKSKACQLPKLKFDGKMLPFVLSICKEPWKIIIEFLPFDLPWYAKLNMKPFIINIDNNEKNGVFSIKSNTAIKARIRYINFGVAKAYLSTNGMIRYDCTKPRGLNNWLKRARYNLQAPNGQYTSMFYKLKIRMEIKVKKFNWFKFNYECKRCEDLVNKSGTFGLGPPSCANDMQKHSRYMLELELRRCDNRRHRGKRCYLP